MLFQVIGMEVIVPHLGKRLQFNFAKGRLELRHSCL